LARFLDLIAGMSATTSAELSGRVETRSMETITLRRTTNGWTATSASYRALFGTDTIPTAFMAHASAEMVRAEIERLNPRAHVNVALDVAAYRAERRRQEII
jgi:hypothetical protein